MNQSMKVSAVAIASLFFGIAHAETSVNVGGVYDVGYMFKRIASLDNPKTGQSTGGTTTETLGDGAGQGSRIIINAKEDIAPGWSSTISLDLRFGSILEGTNGVSSNDRKALFLYTPYGTLRWGVQSIAQAQYWDYEEKPYMVNVQDLEVVKYGVLSKRDESLTSRETEYDSPILHVGPVQTRVKFGYAFGANRTTGANNTDGTNSGDILSAAWTGALKCANSKGNCITWGVSSIAKVNTTPGAVASARNGMHFSENYINIHPVDGLKIGFSYNVYKGFGDTATGSDGIYKEKNTNLIIAYNWGNRFQIGAARAHLNDLGSTRNSGKSWMIGGTYFFSRNFFAFAAWQKEDYARNESGYKKFSGTKTNFTDTWVKQDLRYTRIGIVKTF